MSESKEVLGSIVAFEGHPETISTQLRLLPTSPQILILPGIQCYLPAHSDGHNDTTFDVAKCIRETHNAVMARNETAHSFLQGSTANNKRLVFMNGGTPNAQAHCVRSFMRHETDGDSAQAQRMYHHLVEGGLAGIEERWQSWKSKETEVTGDETMAEQEDEPQDPISRAMRAADALDRQTANLQPCTDLDLTSAASRARPRSMSLPLYGYSDNFGDAAPFFVFGANKRPESVVSRTSAEELEQDDEGEFVPATPRFSVTHYDRPENESPYSGFTNLQSPVRAQSPSCVGEAYNHQAGQTLQTPLDMEFFTPRSESYPRTPDTIVGDVPGADPRLPGGRRASLPRVRSLDRLYSNAAKFRDLCIPEDTSKPDSATPVPIRPHSLMVLTNSNDPASPKISQIARARTIIVKPKRATIALTPVPQEKKRRSVRSSYVDRGTDAEKVVPEEPAEFKPVFPVTEDLVVYFKDEVPDALLDSIVAAYRAGKYPVLAPPKAPETTQDEEDETEQTNHFEDASDIPEEAPGTPESRALTEGGESDANDPEEPQTPATAVDVDEYDPFAYVQPSRPVSRPAQQPIPTMRVDGPPTPEKTPSPSIADQDEKEKFREFGVSASQTAVNVQNSLRSVLNIYYPPEAEGYRQFHFSLLPELEGLWKPIFREAEPDSPRKDNRRMDQILAIGSQRGVKRDFSAAITGQLEKLGSKSSGLSRSGRLDFRYLLANAMQAFTAQPLANQAADNPFTNSYLLATLLIPHLETYLALHSEVRYLLLEFPPEHLPTVLALQKLVGVDLMKVAQILDPSSKELLPFTHIKGASINGSADGVLSSTSLGRPVPSSGVSAGDVTVSKANFLLTTAATDSEIATFISTVWKILAAVSEFYAPEVPAKKASLKKGKPAPLQSVFTAFPKPVDIPSTPITPTPGAVAPAPTVSTTLPGPALSSPALSTPAPLSPSTRAPSITTLKTLKSMKSKYSQGRSRKRPPTGDGASFVTFDPAEDSDYDEESRRLMPLYMQKPRRRKGDSRKALKFLGLA